MPLTTIEGYTFPLSHALLPSIRQIYEAVAAVGGDTVAALEAFDHVLGCGLPYAL